MIERVLVAGLGSIGRRHLTVLRGRLPGARIMVLRHGGCEETIAGADDCTTSLDEAVAFAPQIAVIATPAPFHAAPAKVLAQAGTHLLVEKPMATTVGEARALADAAKAASVVLQIGYNLRFLDSLAAFRTALVAGRIGRVASVRAEVGQYLPDWRPGADWRSAVSARPDLGGGVLLELSHEFDFLGWIFGEVRSVRGWTGRQGGLGLEVEDTAHVLLEFAAPLPAGAKGVAPVASVSLDFIRRDTARRCVAIGENGTLTWDGVASEVRLSRPGEDDVLLHDTPADRNASYVAQLDAFLSSVETGASVSLSADDGLAALEIVEAVRRSHAADGAAVAPDRRG